MSNVIRARQTVPGVRQLRWEEPATRDESLESSPASRVPRPASRDLGEAGGPGSLSVLPEMNRETLLAQLRAEGQAEIQAAQRKAAELLAAARQEAEQIRAEARAEGFAQGLEDARNHTIQSGACAAQCVQLKETQGRVDQALAAFQQAVGQLRERQQKTLDEAQQELIDIAFEMAAKVVQTEIQTHPEVVLSAVQSALSRFKGGDIVLRLHPEDAETVRGALLRLTSELSSGTTISIAEDPTVERGGCVADGEGGRVDNQPSVKLELLHQAVST